MKKETQIFLNILDKYDLKETSIQECLEDLKKEKFKSIDLKKIFKELEFFSTYDEGLFNGTVNSSIQSLKLKLSAKTIIDLINDKKMSIVEYSKTFKDLTANRKLEFLDLVFEKSNIQIELYDFNNDTEKVINSFSKSYDYIISSKRPRMITIDKLNRTETNDTVNLSFPDEIFNLLNSNQLITN